MLLLLLADGLFLVLFAGDDEFAYLDYFLGALQAQGDGLGLGDWLAEVGGHFQLDRGGSCNDLLTVAVVIDVHQVLAWLGPLEEEFLGSVSSRVIGRHMTANIGIPVTVKTLFPVWVGYPEVHVGVVRIPSQDNPDVDG